MSDSDDDVINFYENNKVKQFIKKYHNPNYSEKMPISHPFRGIILGSSGSGKSVCALNIIKKMNGTFNQIFLFTMNKEEPLYEYLESEIDYPFFQVFEGIEEVENFDFTSLDPEQTLVIFDDMVIHKESRQKNIKELFIRGRKLCEGAGISTLYLSQSFYNVPTIIRKNLNFIFVRKLTGKRDIDSIMRECSSDCSKEQMRAIYEYCCDENDVTKFMMINLNATSKERFRKGFSKILNIDNF